MALLCIGGGACVLSSKKKKKVGKTQAPFV